MLNFRTIMFNYIQLIFSWLKCFAALLQRMILYHDHSHVSIAFLFFSFFFFLCTLSFYLDTVHAPRERQGFYSTFACALLAVKSFIRKFLIKWIAWTV